MEIYCYSKPAVMSHHFNDDKSWSQSQRVDASIKYSVLLCEPFPYVGKWSQSQTLEFEPQCIFPCTRIWVENVIYNFYLYVKFYTVLILLRGKETKSIISSHLFSTTSGAGIVKGYRIIKFWHIEIIRRCERNWSLRLKIVCCLLLFWCSELL